jgi:hypothetical protein
MNMERIYHRRDAEGAEKKSLCFQRPLLWILSLCYFRSDCGVAVSNNGAGVMEEDIIHFCRKRVAHIKAPKIFAFLSALLKRAQV